MRGQQQQILSELFHSPRAVPREELTSRGYLDFMRYSWNGGDQPFLDAERSNGMSSEQKETPSDVLVGWDTGAMGARFEKVSD